ncbi:MAG TPA: 3-dehydroquinate synthase [Anaerolineales bacterium]|nr:3-dehydroquinate synthase [Anaerolineales bacterium]
MQNIFLYGPSGTGKSTVGKLLAGNLKLPFVDLDAIIESKAGISIPQIMNEQGEDVFRDLETSALKESLGHAFSVTNPQSTVFALGGGALLREENRALAEANGKVILLMAELDTLITRLEFDSKKRPLFAGDLRQKLSSMLGKRGEHYTSFEHQFKVDGKRPGQIVQQLQIELGRHHLSAMGEYDVIVDLVERLIKSFYPNSIIVTDENVAKFHLDTVRQILPDAKIIILPAGEAHKNLESVSHLWESFLENGLDRRSTVIALGGGVIGDLAGFAASTYMRGMDWVAVPTTLLSMVDASLGGKTGFDLPEGKNLIGSFHPPKLVLADPGLLLTLPERELISGMAEVVKHGIISEPELFELCRRGMDWVKQNLEEIVKRAIAVKIKVIEEDPYEKGIRAALNLGHTVGHAVELVSRFELRHGEAVAIGMMVEAKYSARIGLAGSGLVEAVGGTLSALGLPVHIPDGMPREEIIRAMRMDKKKKAKSIRFALPVEIGRVELVEVSDLESVLE